VGVGGGGERGEDAVEAYEGAEEDAEVFVGGPAGAGDEDAGTGGAVGGREGSEGGVRL
jgi:hypothetical protein